MSAVSPITSLVTRRNLIGLGAIDVVLFVLANVTAKSGGHPGTISNIFWVAFVVGAALLIVLIVIALFHRARATG